MTDLRVLSLHQPWASLVAVGVKSIETRSWPTKHRGRIGIASTQTRPSLGLTIGEYSTRWLAGDVVLHKTPYPLVTRSLPLGAIVATANLLDCVPIVDDGAARNCVDVRVGHPEAGAVLRLDRTEPGWPTTLVETITDVLDQLPYGDFTPGRWAWLLDDVKPTTERCPACWPDENGMVDVDQTHRVPLRYVTPDERCLTCDGKGSCDPVPVKGHQRLWRWNP